MLSKVSCERNTKREGVLILCFVESRWETEANIQITEDDSLNKCKTHSTTSSSGLWKNISIFFFFFFTTPRKKSHKVTNLNHVGECVVTCLQFMITFLSVFCAECFCLLGRWGNRNEIHNQLRARVLYL